MIKRLLIVLFLGCPIGWNAFGSGFGDCYSIAMSNISGETAFQALNLCNRASVGFMDCYNLAKNIPGETAFEAINTCNKAGLGFIDCYNVAKNNIPRETVFEAIAACGQVP